MMVHLRRRGRENLGKLKQTDFAVTADGDRELYVYSVNDEQTKNHQDDLHRREGRMYEVKGKFKFAFHLWKPRTLHEMCCCTNMTICLNLCIYWQYNMQA